MYSRNFEDRESGGQDGGLRSQRDREISGRIPADYNGEMIKKRAPEPREEKPPCAVQQEEARCSTCERCMPDPAPCCPPQRPSKRRGLLGGLFGGDMETDDLLLLGLAFLLLTNNRDRDCDDGERDDIFLLLAMLFIIGM